jgi:hypothetical protein
MMNSIPPLLVSAAAYLEAQEKDIIFRWVQIASRLPSHFNRTDESLKELLDHMPEILVQLRQLMVEVVDLREPITSVLDSAVAHAEVRYNQKIPARTVMKEYQILRHEIWATLQQWPQVEQFSALDVFLLSERLNFLLDDIISVTLDTFTTLMTEQDNGGETK